jgi:murein DD-endopeptidase MepM/ murein hydrolase activator NlpD
MRRRFRKKELEKFYEATNRVLSHALAALNGRLDKIHVVLAICLVLSLTINGYYYIFIKSFEQDISDIAAEEVVESDAGFTADSDKKKPSVEIIDNKMMEKSIFTVKHGDTLYNIFESAGISPKDSYLISQAINKVYKVSKLKVGHRVEVEFSSEDNNGKDYYSNVKCVKITSDTQKIIVHFDKKKQRFVANISDIMLKTKRIYYSGDITDSLYSTANQHGVSPYAIMHFIRLFSFSLDFQRDLRSGDKYEIYYEYYENDEGKKIKEGDILYASITTGGKKLDMFRFEHDTGRIEYYDRNGENVRKTLLKTPINGARISSGFGVRIHPVLGYSRMHKGLDYAAPTGTPIFAAGDGVIESVRYQQKGFGRSVKIKHTSKYSTLYAHLSKFASGIKKGIRVQQGDVIGYVGSSGMATGPHLHYEVHVNGRQVNPAKISFPKSDPLQKNNLQKFKKIVALTEREIRINVQKGIAE